MATSNDTELKEYIVNYIESDELADELAESGAFEEGQFVYTPDEEVEDEIEKQFDLLWQNSNPTISQSSQSIPIANLSQYNTFVIKVQRAIDHTLVYNYSNHAITPEDNICFNIIGVFGYISYCRNVYVNLSSGELVINNGYIQSAIGSGSVNNDKLIVTHLYGLKTRLYTRLGELPDAELSETSENAVQNKAVTKKLNTIGTEYVASYPFPASGNSFRIQIGETGDLLKYNYTIKFTSCTGVPAGAGIYIRVGNATTDLDNSGVFMKYGLETSAWDTGMKTALAYQGASTFEFVYNYNRTAEMVGSFDIAALSEGDNGVIQLMGSVGRGVQGASVTVFAGRLIDTNNIPNVTHLHFYLNTGSFTGVTGTISVYRSKK